MSGAAEEAANVADRKDGEVRAQEGTNAELNTNLANLKDLYSGSIAQLEIVQ
jgi:hypothetical protein